MLHHVLRNDHIEAVVNEGEAASTSNMLNVGTKALDSPRVGRRLGVMHLNIVAPEASSDLLGDVAELLTRRLCSIIQQCHVRQRLADMLVDPFQQNVSNCPMWSIDLWGLQTAGPEACPNRHGDSVDHTTQDLVAARLCWYQFVDNQGSTRNLHRAILTPSVGVVHPSMVDITGSGCFVAGWAGVDTTLCNHPAMDAVGELRIMSEPNPLAEGLLLAPRLATAQVDTREAGRTAQHQHRNGESAPSNWLELHKLLRRTSAHDLVPAVPRGELGLRGCWHDRRLGHHWLHLQRWRCGGASGG
mmetsp:Transcript_25365/g.84783  ORF Transcript_25365/g.84783 Transcript_25365/m.84783 type:complete len:301 (-) Transcript_25365:164-1066(-)